MLEQSFAPPVDSPGVLSRVDVLEKQAARCRDPAIQRILLASGCEILDRALRRHKPPTAV